MSFVSQDVYSQPEVRSLRADLALALRAAAAHGLSEGVCNQFSVAVPKTRNQFLMNPRGLLWSEVQADDIVLVDEGGNRLAGRHEIDPSALFIHAAVHHAGKVCVMHTHMPYSTALTVTSGRCLDTRLSQNAMRFHGRVTTDGRYNGVAVNMRDGERIARALRDADVIFLGNRGVIVCGERVDCTYDDLYYLERACMVQVLAQSTGQQLAPVDEGLAAKVGQQSSRERLQSQLFFDGLRRTLT
jgi:ribulose-5-phosphate 4-epimerase/fuculose-1-phosphate aldolase